MMKILPLKKDKNPEPYFRLNVEIGYGEHCDDSFTTNTLIIDDEKYATEDALGISYGRQYINEKDACDLVTLICRAVKEVSDRHIVLNEGITDFWCEGMKPEEIELLRHYYEKYPGLFDYSVDHNWYGITDAYIVYFDEDWRQHNVEVI